MPNLKPFLLPLLFLVLSLPVLSQNICFENLIVETQPCTPNQVFFVDIDMDATNITGEFELIINGALEGTYNYSELPLLNVGPFDGQTPTDYHFLVQDVQLPNCAEDFTLENASCNCGVDGFFIDDLECSNSGATTYTGWVHLDFYSGLATSFDLIQDGNVIGTYLFADLPLFLPNIQGAPGQTSIFELVPNDPNCPWDVFTVVFPSCPPTCTLFDGIEVYDISCNDDGTINFEFNFTPISPGPAGFKLFIDGELYETYSYNQVPVYVENVDINNSDLFTIQFCDVADPNCCSNLLTVALPPGCGATNCEINDLIAEAWCTQNEEFFIDLAFFNNQPPSDTFVVTVNNQVAGFFLYGDLNPFVTVGPFIGDGTTNYIVKVSDINEPDCNDIFIIGTVDCINACPIFSDLEVFDLECNDNGTYDFFVNFNVTAPNNGGFDLFINDVFYEFYSYSDLPIQVLGVGPFIDFFTVQACDNDNDDCCSNLLTVLPDCGDPCEIDGLLVEPTGCSNSGNFFVDLEFSHIQPLTDSFIVKSNGTVLGVYAYSDLDPFITVGPFNGDGQTTYTITVCDQNNPDCSASSTFGPVLCNADCPIFDGTIVYDVNCISTPNQTSVSFWVNFNPNPNLQGGFTVFINGDDFASFSYQDLPVNITLNNITSPSFELNLCHNNDPSCCSGPITVQVPPNCYQNCGVEFFEIDDVECNDVTGSYTAQFYAGFINFPGEVDLYQDNEYLGTYGPGDFPLTLSDLQGTPGTPSVFELIPTDPNQNCSGAVYTVLWPFCGGCDIEIQDIFDLQCGNVPGTYTFGIEFITSVITPNAQVTLYVNGVVEGIFPANSPIIATIDGYGPGDILEIKLCLVNSAGVTCCSEVFVIELPGCNCEIDDLILETFCDGDQPYLSFTFNSAGTSSHFILGSCFVIDEFPYGQVTYTIPLTDDILSCAIGNLLPIYIADINDPNCFAAGFAQVPDCDQPNCELWDLSLEATDCNNAGQFEVILDFNYQGVGDLFTVVGNGQVYGTFNYDELPLALGPFDGDGQTIYEFVIIDLANVSCSIFGEIGPINCDNCELWDFAYESDECEGPNPVVFFDFEHANTGTHFVVSICNGVLLDTLPYGGPYSIEIPAQYVNCLFNNQIPFQVYDLDSGADCSLSAIVDLEDCSDDCAIFDIEVEVVDCANGEFYLVIDFETQNTGPSGFVMFVDSESFGPFSYGDLPIDIGPLPTNGTDYDILILDLDDPICFGYYALGVVDCDPGPCSITALEAEFDCNLNNTYDLIIDFNYANTTNPFFDVYIDNLFLGFFAFDDLPIVITDLTLDPNQTVLVSVNENDNPNCAAATDIFVPACLISNCIEISALFPTDTTITNPIGSAFLFTTDSVSVYTGSSAVTWMEIGYFSSFVHAMDKQIFMSGTIELDFSNLAEPPVALDAKVDQGELILGANGNPLIDIPFLSLTGPTTYNLAPGVIAVVTPYPDNSGEAKIRVEGQLYTLEIGNIDGIIADICYEVDADVWPGDANSDNIANQFDLLSVGVAFDTEGPARAMDNISWNAMSADNWNMEFADGTNFKHADCNGDGVIDEDDLAALHSNYQNMHGPIPVLPQITVDDNDPPLFVAMPSPGDITPNEPFLAPIILGTANKPVDEIYGIAFTIKYNTTYIEDAQVEFISSWFGDNSDLIDFIKIHPDEGEINLALSRIDHLDTDGYGAIGYFIGITDDLAGMVMPDVEIIDVYAIDHNEDLIPLYLPGNPNQIPSSVDQTILEEQLVVYPNPAINQFQIRNVMQEEMTRIRIFNALGQSMAEIKPNTDLLTVSTQGWSPGVYFIEIQLEQNRITKRIEITKP